MGQITRAWTSTGQLRFDALAEIKQKHKPKLDAWTWENVYDRPDLQILAVTLKMKDNFKYFQPLGQDPINAYAFADAAYNGGIRGVDLERKACYVSGKCNPKVWFGNVERFCMKSTAALYGQRSACDINRHHVSDVLITRAPKYKRFF